MIAGTEMNKQGQKFVDDFTAEAMKTVETEFLKGARIMTGHTLMQKNLGFGITSREVEERFKGDLEKRNRFFETIGALKPVGGYQGGSERGLRVRQIWERGI
jgi:hypothetical protein